jgi:hypothetical protein
MVAVFCEAVFPGMEYALNEVFLRRAGMHWEMLTDADAYTRHPAAIKVNYSAQALPGLQIYCSQWTFAGRVDPHFKPPMAWRHDFLCLFPDDHGDGFDVFAMVFWFLSRYEEYQPFRGDALGRFSPKDSCIPEEWQGFPLVDMAVNHCLKQLGLSPDLRTETAPTIDIDIAFRFAGRDALRSLGAAARDLLRHPALFRQRLKALASGKDPWDSFDWFTRRMQDVPAARVFWQLHHGRNPHDKQVRIGHPHFLERFRAVQQRVVCGIHPSWDSHDKPAQWEHEQADFIEIAGHAPVHARQHFLRFHFPDTFRRIEKAGIRYDYSIGWAALPGFRAGTCKPFAFYDLLKQEERHLVFIPTCIMDVSCRQYQGMDTEQAIAAGRELKARIAAVGGIFCFIFHNESLGETAPWEGWTKVFNAWMQP